MILALLDFRQLKNHFSLYSIGLMIVFTLAAMKKRHRESTSPSTNSRKLMSGTESLNGDGLKNPYLVLISLSVTSTVFVCLFLFSTLIHIFGLASEETRKLG